MLAVYFAMVAAVASVTGISDAEVEVAWTHQARERIIVEDRVWRCEGTSCHGRIADTPLLKQRACRAIARYAGRVTRFTSASGSLDADALARCNRDR